LPELASSTASTLAVLERVILALLLTEKCVAPRGLRELVSIKGALG
jgi:hypothetical protein